MDIASDSSLLSENTFTWIATLLSLAIVLVPFSKGIRLCLRAWSATRHIEKNELIRAAKVKPARSATPFSVLMLRVLKKSLGGKENPPDFVFDASRQYIMNEFEISFTRLITMYASLLPPIGFIGTTGGMLILFISMHLADDSLELGALAIALTSSVFALIAYAALEGFKIKLYSRLLSSIRDVETLFHKADARREKASSAQPVMPKGATASA